MAVASFPDVTGIPSSLTFGQVETFCNERNMWAYLKKLAQFAKNIGSKELSLTGKETIQELEHILQKNIIQFFSTYNICTDDIFFAEDYSFLCPILCQNEVFIISIEELETIFVDDIETFEGIMLTLAFIRSAADLDTSFDFLDLLEDFEEYEDEDLNDNDIEANQENVLREQEKKKLENICNQFESYSSQDEIEELFYTKKIRADIYSICVELIESAKAIKSLTNYIDEDSLENGARPLIWIAYSSHYGDRDNCENEILSYLMESSYNSGWDGMYSIQFFPNSADYTPNELKKVQYYTKKITQFLECFKKLAQLEE